MTETGADSIPAITEQDASGEIAALYADLRITLGVPFVNLIWRHLATIPGGLAWTWTLVKPLYLSGELDRLSVETAARAGLPSLTRWPDFVWEGVAIDRGARRLIARLIDGYNRANGVNFLALLAAVSVLRDGMPARLDTGRALPWANRPLVATDALPPLPKLSELSPPLLALVRRLDQFGRLGSSDAIASLYLHLALWPPFLSIAYTSLEPLHRSGELAKIQQGVIAFGRQQAFGLAGLVDRNLPAIAPENRAAVLRPLDEFTCLMIGRMIVMGKAMHGLVSGDDG
jgi:hypothetical protein